MAVAAAPARRWAVGSKAGRPGPAASRSASRLLSREMIGLLVLAIVLGAVMSRYVQLLLGNGAPPGSDGGNWLAFGRELFGERVKAAEAGYPPLFPLALHLARLLLAPLPAVKLAGLAAAASVALPVYLILRASLHTWIAAFLAGAAVSSEYAFEVFAWGGYPQLLGAAGLLLSLYWMVIGLDRGRRSALIAAGLAVAATAGLHHLAALELALGGVAVIALQALAIARRPERGAVRRLARRLAILALVAGAGLLPLVPSYLHIAGDLVGNPANPHGFRLIDSMTAIGHWHGDDLLWIAIAAAGLPAALWLAPGHRQATAARVAAAAGLGAGAVLLSQSEVRSVHLLQVSLLLALGLVPAAFRARFPRAASARPYVAGLVVAAAALVMVSGIRAAPVSFRWYRVIDYPALGALDWLQARAGEGGVVVSGESARGGIYGWWVEGYAGLPSFMAVDLRWLSYRSERSQARIAYRMLDPATPAAEVRRLAADNGIGYALIDRLASPGAPARLAAAGFGIAVEHDHVVVMSLGPGSPQP